jgi:peptidoglycan/xylan/chitin deacetylase (PgdA/CDA1 family)
MTQHNEHSPDTRWLRLFSQLTLRGRRTVVFCLHNIIGREWFEHFIDLTASWCSYISLPEFFERKARGALRGNEFVLTFDDGYRSIIDVVHPILLPRHIPYTTFVCTEVINGGPAPWFVRLEALLTQRRLDEIAPNWTKGHFRIQTQQQLYSLMRALPLNEVLSGLERAESFLGLSAENKRASFLTSEQLTQLACNEIVTIGSHTHRHPILANLNEKEQEHEIKTSADVIADITGKFPKYFAYPNGTYADFNRRTVNILAGLGFEGAVTTLQRTVRIKDDNFCIPRIIVDNWDKISKITAKMTLPFFSVYNWKDLRYRKTFLRNSGRKF